MEEAVASIQGDSPREGGLWTRRRYAVLIVGIVLALLLGGIAYVLYAQGGGPVPAYLAFLSPAESRLLASSSPAEQTLRSLRLAGIDRAAVGEANGIATARVEVPAVTSAADVEIAWQTAVAALSQSYPGARVYDVQLFGPDATALVQLTFPGSEARSDVTANDPAALRRVATVRYLSEQGGGR